MIAPVLETPRLVLRPHRREDFADLATLWADAAVTRWIGGRPFTAEESWARLLRYGGLWPLLGFGYLAVCDRASGAFLGDVGLADFHRAVTPSLDGMAEAGWVLLPSAWGRGIAVEAVVALLDWYRGTPAPRPLACLIAPENAGSLRVARRCGFVDWTTTTYRDSPALLLRRGSSEALGEVVRAVRPQRKLGGG